MCCLLLWLVANNYERVGEGGQVSAPLASNNPFQMWGEVNITAANYILN